MTAATPGQAAYRTWMLARPPAVPGDIEEAIANTWQAMRAKGRARWESAAQAGVDASPELAEAREHLDTLRALIGDVLRTYKGAHHGDSERSDVSRRTFGKWTERAAEAGVRHW